MKGVNLFRTHIVTNCTFILGIRLIKVVELYIATLDRLFSIRVKTKLIPLLILLTELLLRQKIELLLKVRPLRTRTPSVITILDQPTF